MYIYIYIYNYYYIYLYFFILCIQLLSGLFLQLQCNQICYICYKFSQTIALLQGI